jgi:hypothetical protein
VRACVGHFQIVDVLRKMHVVNIALQLLAVEPEAEKCHAGTAPKDARAKSCKVRGTVLAHELNPLKSSSRPAVSIRSCGGHREELAPRPCRWRHSPASIQNRKRRVQKTQRSLGAEGGERGGGVMEPPPKLYETHGNRKLAWWKHMYETSMTNVSGRAQTHSDVA